MTIRDSLTQVQALFRETSGTKWAAEGARVVSDPEYNVYKGHIADCVEDDDAAFIAACHELFRTHGPELMKMLDRHGAGDADRSAELTTAWMAGAESVRDRAEERLRDLHDSIRTVYDTVPSLPIDETTMDAATDALHAFCLLVGIHKIDIDTPRDDSARAGERGVSGG